MGGAPCSPGLLRLALGTKHAEAPQKLPVCLGLGDGCCKALINSVEKRRIRAFELGNPRSKCIRFSFPCGTCGRELPLQIGQLFEDPQISQQLLPTRIHILGVYQIGWTTTRPLHEPKVLRSLGCAHLALIGHPSYLGIALAEELPRVRR